MLQADLYRDISRVTGETIASIKRVGFLIADPSQPISDPEAESLGFHTIDWDEFAARQEDEEASGFATC